MDQYKAPSEATKQPVPPSSMEVFNFVDLPAPLPQTAHVTNLTKSHDEEISQKLTPSYTQVRQGTNGGAEKALLKPTESKGVIDPASLLHTGSTLASLLSAASANPGAVNPMLTAAIQAQAMAYQNAMMQAQFQAHALAQAQAQAQQSAQAHAQAQQHSQAHAQAQQSAQAHAQAQQHSQAHAQAQQSVGQRPQAPVRGGTSSVPTSSTNTVLFADVVDRSGKQKAQIEEEKPDVDVDSTMKVCYFCFQGVHMNDMAMHRLKIHPDLSEKMCLECGKSLESGSQLKFHVLRLHRPQQSGPIPQIKCSGCYQSFNTQNELVQHLRSSNICRIRPRNVSQPPLRKSMDRPIVPVVASSDESNGIEPDRQEEENDQEDDMLEDSLDDYDGASDGRRGEAEAVVTPFECPHCHKHFQHRKGLQSHIAWQSCLKEGERAAPKKLARPVCPRCGVSFGAQSGLTNHLKWNTCVSKKSRPSFAQKLVQASTVVPLLKCVGCSRRFVNVAAIKSHQRANAHCAAVAHEQLSLLQNNNGDAQEAEDDEIVDEFAVEEAMEEALSNEDEKNAPNPNQPVVLKIEGLKVTFDENPQHQQQQSTIDSAQITPKIDAGEDRMEIDQGEKHSAANIDKEAEKELPKPFAGQKSAPAKSAPGLSCSTCNKQFKNNIEKQLHICARMGTDIEEFAKKDDSSTSTATKERGTKRLVQAPMQGEGRR